MKPVQDAQLALLLEVTATPKPGAVDRRRDHEDLRFEHFLAGAVEARDGLAAAAREGGNLGAAFERAVAGMADQEGGNTHFGALLLLVPLVRTAASGALTPDRATATVEGTGVADAASFYRSFEHVSVGVGEPPEDLEDLDVRRGADAVPAVEARGLTLRDVMAKSECRDGIAREWCTGFERTFGAADRLAEGRGPIPDRAAALFLELLAAEPDTHVAKQHGPDVARETSDRAQAVLDGELSAERLADDLVAAGVNPGTTADLVAGGLFVALSREEITV